MGINLYNFMPDGGEMGAMIRSKDWAATSLGSLDAWPLSLKLAAGMLLGTPFPMYIAWGPEFIQLYNDGFRPILGSTKHPEALGISTCQTFSEIWEVIGPMFQEVMKGQSVGLSDLALPINRNGYVEECHFNFSYSPLFGDSGAIAGVLVTVIETTEQIRTLEALRTTTEHLKASHHESERQRTRLKRFFMEAPAGVCILDGPEFVFELVNPGYQQLFPGRDLIGRPIVHAIPELKDQPIWDILQHVYNADEPFEGKGLLVPLARNDDQPILDRYFDFIYQPRHDQEGKVDGILVFVYEVTDIISSQKLAQSKETRYRSIVEQSPVPMLIVRFSDLVFEEINPPMLQLMGQGSSLIGKKADEFGSGLVGQSIMRELKNTWQTGESYYGVEQPIFPGRARVEETRYFNISLKVLIENGKKTAILVSAIEVTEQVLSRKKLEKAEDRVRLALSAARLGTFDMDLEKGTLEWDERCRTLFGISHQNAVTFEKDFTEGLHPEDRDKILKVIRSVFIRSVSNGNYDVEYRTIGLEDGQVRWVKAMGKAYFNDQEQPLRFVGAVLDITESKQDELRKDDFIGIVSHELKTPLTSLNAYTQILQKSDASRQDKFLADILDRVHFQVKKMNTLINGFLNTTRLESGKIHLEKEDFNLDELVKDAIEESRVLTPGHELVFKPCAPILVCADRDKIGSVITNLLSNAAKYSDSGTHIEVECKVNSNDAQVSVRDEGMGIPQSDFDRLFERYYRVKSNRGRHISGFGIGLYLSAEIIDRHSGKIWVESELGKGSVFYFTIPLKA